MISSLGSVCLFVVLVALLGLSAASAAPITFYVATDGSDEWSGKLPAPNGDRSDGPFASLTRARDAIRELKGGGGLPGPVTVQLRGGKYFITETVVFGPQDSGTRDCPVSYVAYPGEKPELVGGRRITGLKPAIGGTLVASLPEARAGKWSFRQLFVDGKREIRARYPNFDPKDPYRGGFLYAQTSPGGFGFAVGCIHNVGDWMDYKVKIPADGDYNFWMLYGALNAPFGNKSMDGRTALFVDGGPAIPLMNLADTASWAVSDWSHTATLKLTAGEHTIRWQNLKGGGLDLGGYALSDDPAWKPALEELPKAAPGKHVVIIGAADFVAFNGKQLAVSAGGVGQGPKTKFFYKPGDVKPSWLESPGAEVHIFQTGNCRAFKEITSLVGIDEDTRTVTIGGKECSSSLYPGDRYFVENIAEELDSPGEWYLNKGSGELTYMPRDSFSEDSVMIAPTVQRILDFQGDAKAGKPLSNIRIAGLIIGCNDYSPDDGCEGYGMGNNGTLYFKDATGCAVENCTFRNTGKQAVCISGGDGNRVANNEVADSAEGGILILGSARNVITNNHIHHCGAIYKHPAGVALEGPGTDENVISHNLIHDMTRYGISIKTGGFRNVIQYNHVHHTNLETFDTGGIEVTQQDRNLRSGSLIDHNIVGDTIGYSFDGKKPVYLSWGIYLDSFAGGYTVTNNICYRSAHGGIMLQGGKDNKVENNIFVDGALNQAHLNNFADNSTGQVLERNIFYYTDPDAPLFSGGNLSDKVIHVDHNLYCHTGDKPLKIQLAGIASYADWQKKGFDVNSIIADPLFVDPAHDDYSLKPDSPAFKLGFKAIDTKGIGIVEGGG